MLDEKNKQRVHGTISSSLLLPSTSRFIGLKSSRARQK